GTSNGPSCNHRDHRRNKIEQGLRADPQPPASTSKMPGYVEAGNANPPGDWRRMFHEIGCHAVQEEELLRLRQQVHPD
uniref:Uncharacterized protein n=1 Tax=Cannabis sativa TaxID=3483 RepID=A0A803PK95_CANSA